VNGRRGFLAAAICGWMVVCVLGLGGMAAASSAVVITAGNQQITFAGVPKSGALGSVGGYDSLGFDFESGQAGMFGDVQIGTDSSGNPTLAGTLEAVPASDTVPAGPTSATLTVTAGETLLVTDSAGNYVLVQITNATPHTVWFTYTIQTSVATVQAPAAQGQPGTTSGAGSGTTGQSTTQSATPMPSATPSATASATASGQSGGSSQATQPGASGNAGVYTMTGNCLTVADTSGNGALGIGVVVSPMFGGQSIADAQQNMELVLNVAISAPSDVSNVAVQQSGQVGSYGYTQKLLAFGQPSGGDWPFSMQQTSTSDVYQILITSPTLAADGVANPSTGVTEVDWTFNTTQGCGSGTQTAQAGGAQGQGQAATPSAQPTPSTSAQTTQSTGSSPMTIQLQIGGTTATVNGQPQSLIAQAEISSAGRTMVPFRFLGQALGATVSWDGTSRTASYQLGSTDVAITIGSSTATVNGRQVTLDAPAVIVNGSTLVPVRFVSQALGATVSWDASTQTVTITYGAP